MAWKKEFDNYKSDQAFVSRIYKEFLKYNSKKTNNVKLEKENDGKYRIYGRLR